MRQSPLKIAIHTLLTASTTATMAVYAQDTDTSEEVVDLGVLVVTASADASKSGLPPAVAGDQVALGSRVGILGVKGNLDIPFSTTAYTNAYINNQQADSVGDVLKHDPSVQVARGFGNFQEAYLVRGFVTNSDDTMMNGLYGVLPRQYIASELFERVELQRGANTFLNGMAPAGSNKGGTINLLPKRAGNEPTRTLTISTEDGNNAKIATDIAQRFYDNKVGVRAVAVYQDGGTAIDDENAELGLASVGLDYKDDKARVSMDLGYQNHKLSQTRTNVNISSVIPNAPKSSSNWAQPWSYSNEKDVFGTLRAEYDFTDNLTAYGAYGFRVGDEENSLANLSASSTDGTGSTYRFDNTRKETVNTAELGVRGKFTTGKLAHDWVLSGNIYDQNRKNAYAFDWRNSLSTNLYSPTSYTKPSWSSSAIFGGELDNPITTNKTQLSSIAIADTLSAFDKKVQLTLGARLQSIELNSYNYNTGAQTSAYDDDEITPAVALVYRPTRNWSVFANYMQSLSAGETAPLTTTLNGTTVALTNAGEAMKPYVTEQSELGIKYQGGGVGAGLTIFETDKPNYRTVNTTFEEAGKNRHRGVELSVYGEPADNWRVLGGMTYLDTQQLKTGNSNTEGKQVLGAPKWQYNLGVEYDIARIDGLTLTGDISHVAKRYADATNTLRVPDYTTLDIGGRYRTDLFGKDVTINAKVVNVTGEDYWRSVGGYENTAGNNSSGYLNAGEPRHVKVSATFSF